MKQRVCVVGLGPIGNLHADIYVEDALCELVAVCDLVEERAQTAGERLGVAHFRAVDEMLAAAKPDIVSVATGGYEYGSDHHQPVMQAFAAGAHVLCEKPISDELSPAAEMVAAGREQGLCFGIDFNHRFTPATYQAERWVAEGRLGDLLFINMSLWIGRFDDPESEVYHLKALNPHSIDLMRHFGGPVDRVHCFATKAPGRTIWSTASINMQFASGAVGHLTSSYDIARGHPMERCEVAGSGGRFVIEDMWQQATLYPADSQERRVFANPVLGGYRGFDDTFRARLHRFVEQVAEGVAPEEIDGSGADALEGLRVILASIESLQSGKVVSLAD